jgi:hypothetical protein
MSINVSRSCASCFVGLGMEPRMVDGGYQPRRPGVPPTSLGLLDWCPREIAPLRPGAVVVPDVRVAEEVPQDEPPVGRPFPDSARVHRPDTHP